MKKQSRIITAVAGIAAAFVLCLSLAGCGAKGIAGTWKYEESGVTETLELKSDGTATLEIEGTGFMDGEIEGTWEKSGDSETEATLNTEVGNLTMSLSEDGSQLETSSGTFDRA